ncbi:MAG: hypothetical protein QM535_15290 [Limnohabitans sp.]|nr:hypothetical protein [Limnohabitans sp.]
MITLTEIFFSFACATVILICSYFVSTIALFAVGQKDKKIPVFWNLFSGLFFIVGIYAIITSKGLTVLFPLPLLILFLLYKLPDEAKNQTYSYRPNFVFLLSTIVVQFLMYLYFINHSAADNVKFISGDFSIYYRAAEMLNKSGVEACNFVLEPKSTGALTPYHYGDIWVYALLDKIVSINPSIVFLISFTVLSFVFTMGVYQFCLLLFFKYDVNKKYFYLLIFSGLFSGFNFCFPYFILPSAEAYTLSVFNWGKVIVLSTCMIGLLITLAQKKQETILCTLAVISALLYLNAIPAIFLSLFLLLLIRVFKGDIKFVDFVKYVLGYVSMTAVLMIFLYKFIPHFFKITDHPKNTSNSLLASFHNFKYLKTAFNIFVGSWFQLFTLLPYFILLFLGIISVNRKFSFKNFVPRNDAIIYMVLLFFSGLFAWAIFYPVTVDTVQFFHNILAPLYALAISIILFYLLFVVRNKVYTVLCILLVFASVFLSSYNKPYYVENFNKGDWHKLELFLKDASPKNNVLVNFQSKKSYKYWATKRTDMYIPLNILSYIWSNYHNVSLVIPFIAIDSNATYYKEEKHDIENTSFSRYYFSHKNNVDSTAHIMDDYIKQNDVTYIAVSKDTMLPIHYRNKAIDSLILEKSNFNIYRIK